MKSPILSLVKPNWQRFHTYFLAVQDSLKGDLVLIKWVSQVLILATWESTAELSYTPVAFLRHNNIRDQRQQWLQLLQ